MLNKYGSIHSLTTIFDCTLKEGAEPSISLTPDPNQTGVKWIPLNELSQIVLYPNIREEIVAYVQKRRTIKLIEEQQLKEYEYEWGKWHEKGGRTITRNLWRKCSH